MDQLVIQGGHELSGVLEVSGSKNASLPILMASLVAHSPCTFTNVPGLRDTQTALKILNVLGAQIDAKDSSYKIQVDDQGPTEAPYELVSTQRASFYALGALLGRRRQARVSLPGGCVIGLRPVDLHLKGFRELGVSIEISGGYVEADARQARAGRVFLGGPYGSSVGATCNLLIFASTLEGTTFIDNAACEPEVGDLCRFLCACGAQIEGIGSPHLKVQGVSKLEGTQFAMSCDRIEAATFLMICCLPIASDLWVRGVDMRQQAALLDILRYLGFESQVEGDRVCMKSIQKPQPVECTTLPYPGFPTDCQAQLMVLLTQIPHLSVITEKIYPDRFIHVAELLRMGATIRKEGSSAFIMNSLLNGAPVMASDLRASAALVMAGLIAQGTTTISRVYHIDRGYEVFDEKLKAVGASIVRQKA